MGVLISQSHRQRGGGIKFYKRKSRKRSSVAASSLSTTPQFSPNNPYT
ncbi:hypothetical protein OIU77_026092 [Salix suchowensis]|uniref:Uncharacterized protein n=1 Tax=Salix suchowensis TaxID=1278906 RepID=A0ABQ9C1U5_9ROSI|nr:hypothetical protein OIU77_026092 [Salix suchowensis]